MFAVAVTNAQEPSLIYRPGDTVRVVVRFKAPIIATSMSFQFVVQTGDTLQQGNLSRVFGSGASKNISDTEYEISGTVGERILTGEYRLASIQVISQGVSKNYTAGSDFQTRIIIKIENPAVADFPQIEDLTLQPLQKP
jgi:hypothetical protein